MISTSILRYNLIVLAIELVLLPLPYLCFLGMMALPAHLLICMGNAMISFFKKEDTRADAVAWVLSFLLVLLIGFPLCVWSWGLSTKL